MPVHKQQKKEKGDISNQNLCLAMHFYQYFQQKLIAVDLNNHLVKHIKTGRKKKIVFDRGNQH